MSKIKTIIIDNIFVLCIWSFGIELGIANILISINYNNIECAGDGQLTLDKWLFGTALLIIIPNTFLIILTIGLPLFSVRCTKLIMGIGYVTGLFELAWFIAGAVAIRDGSDCFDDETFFWGWCIAIWIFQTISICHRCLRNDRLRNKH